MLQLVLHQNEIIDVLVIRITKSLVMKNTDSRKNIIVTKL